MKNNLLNGNKTFRFSVLDKPLQYRLRLFLQIVFGSTGLILAIKSIEGWVLSDPNCIYKFGFQSFIKRSLMINDDTYRSTQKTGSPQLTFFVDRLKKLGINHTVGLLNVETLMPCFALPPTDGAIGFV